MKEVPWLENRAEHEWRLDQELVNDVLLLDLFCVTCGEHIAHAAYGGLVDAGPIYQEFGALWEQHIKVPREEELPVHLL